MPQYYQAFGIPVYSEIELTALMPVFQTDFTNPIYVSLGKTPPALINPPLETKPFTIFNQTELLYTIPEIASYYVSNGNKIIIEPYCDNWDVILTYFYSNCLAAALFQRDILPFHVSGIFIEPDKVLLFAANSRIGKSTTAVMLQQKGYAVFTDDTAILSIEGRSCYANASYPVIRLWKKSIKQQTVLNEAEKHLLRNDIDLEKYGFFFHDRFVSDKVEVAGIVFINEQGKEIVVEKMQANEIVESLGDVVYLNQWVAGMKKQVLQFKTFTAIANRVSGWKAFRPKGQKTFRSFANAIEEEIIFAIRDTKKQLETHEK